MQNRLRNGHQGFISVVNVCLNYVGKGLTPSCPDAEYAEAINSKSGGGEERVYSL